jgi:hypothetical protein
MNLRFRIYLQLLEPRVINNITSALFSDSLRTKITADKIELTLANLFNTSQFTTLRCFKDKFRFNGRPIHRLYELL